MKAWIMATLTLLWLWYLYYAFPSMTTIEVPLNFRPQKYPPEANTTFNIPPYRTYQVSTKFILPPTWHNHECGITNMELSIFDSSKTSLLASGSATMLSTYRSYILDLCSDFIMLIPYLFGLSNYEEILKEKIIDEFTLLTPTDLFINSKLYYSNPEKQLRFYKASVIFSQYRQSFTEMFLYVAMLIGFILTGSTFIFTSIYSIFTAKYNSNRKYLNNY